MALNTETVISIIKQYITDVNKNLPVDKVFLYGSYAKGLQHKDSDVDICFFLKTFKSRSRLDILTELFFLKIKYDKDILIEPNAFLVSELNNDNPFVKEVLRTGQEIII